MIKTISFDAAHTLMDVKWHPGRFAFDSATAYGLNLDESTAVSSYDAMVRARWGDYILVNAAGDRVAGDAFWEFLAADWLESAGIDRAFAPGLSAFARERMFTEEAGCFRTYPETVEALSMLRAEGFQLVVVSNWDYTLERTLVALGLRDFFDHVFASLECGVEKPDRALFKIVEKTIGVGPTQILHVGDNPLDDYQGARGAGWRSALLDRSLSATQRPRIPSLLHISEVLTWID